MHCSPAVLSNHFKLRKNLNAECHQIRKLFSTLCSEQVHYLCAYHLADKFQGIQLLYKQIMCAGCATVSVFHLLHKTFKCKFYTIRTNSTLSILNAVNKSVLYAVEKEQLEMIIPNQRHLFEMSSLNGVHRDLEKKYRPTFFKNGILFIRTTRESEINGYPGTILKLAKRALGVVTTPIKVSI